MTVYRQVQTLLCASLALGALAPSASAQVPGSTHTGVNAALIKLFSDFPAFTARAEIRLLDKSQKETMRMPMNFALLDGKVRAEVLLSEMRSAQMPPQVVANLKQMGMEQMVTVVRPDLKSTLVVYPALKAYATTPMATNELQEFQAKATMARKPLAQETVDGHRCTKTQVTLTPQRGQPREALVWYAADMKNFPVQIQMTEEGTAVVMLFQQVKLDKPLAAAFEAPAGYTAHPSVEQLMQSAMLRMFGGQKEK